MKINQLTTTKNYLYEGLDASSLRSIKLWESAGRKLVEYEMTADQITKLFGQVQQGVTDAGSNRTVIGKGKDAAAAVGKDIADATGAPGSGADAVIKAIGGRVTTTESICKLGLTESQIKRMFYVAGTIQDTLIEGVWDKVKGAAASAAGAVANKAQTIGTNLTTKVTADKLMTAWKKAGSPTDSDAVAAIMKQAGVDDAIIASSMKAVAGQTTPAEPPPGPIPTPPVDAQTQKFIQQLVASYQALTPAEKATLKKELQDAVTASDVGGNVVKGTMESRRSKKRTI